MAAQPDDTSNAKWPRNTHTSRDEPAIHRTAEGKLVMSEREYNC